MKNKLHIHTTHHEDFIGVREFLVIEEVEHDENKNFNDELMDIDIIKQEVSKKIADFIVDKLDYQTVKNPDEGHVFHIFKLSTFTEGERRLVENELHDWKAANKAKDNMMGILQDELEKNKKQSIISFIKSKYSKKS